DSLVSRTWRADRRIRRVGIGEVEVLRGSSGGGARLNGGAAESEATIMLDDVESAVPAVARRYLEAHDRRGADAALSAFSAEAKVMDDGNVK
ncbi:MAG: hypothetical protein ACRDRT_05555, partial [Pseudonocardiaceae bacterium]